MRFFNKKFLLSLIIFLSIVLTVCFFLIFFQNSHHSNEQKKTSIRFLALEIADSISFYLKVNDIASIERQVGGSYLTKNVEYLLIRNSDSEIIYQNPESLVGSTYKCAYYNEQVSVLYMGKDIGSLSYCLELPPLIGKSFILYLIAFVLFMIVVCWLLVRVFDYYHKDISELLSNLNSIVPSSPEIQNYNPKNLEMNKIYLKLNHIFQKFNLYSKQLNDKKIMEEKLKLTTQVAHDIKSPLSVLVSISEETEGMPEQERIMLRMAVQNIRDIANDLSSKSMNKQLEGSQSEGVDIFLLSALIDTIISEKRIEYKSNQSINIQAQIDRNTYPLFAKLQPTTFKRVLSNLINNSIEAFDGGGDVQVQLKAVEGWVQVVVKDNGKGIPADKLTSIFERGQSFGKDGKDNSGLGLFHAKESVQAWSGTIEVSSEEGVGTEFTLSLPLAKQPDWFLGEIVLQPGQDFVIVDDDQSIHEIWKNRLGEAGAAVRNMQHFSSADGFESWISKTADATQYIYLFDYELLGSSKTGLDLVEEFGLQEQAVLVTSRYEEQSIRDRCQKIGLKLLPKGLAGYIPIVKDDSFVSEQPKVDCVLLDDNPLIRMNWERKAAEAGLSILTFETSQGLFSKMELFNEETIFYVDQHLKDGTFGMDTAKKLKDKGFAKIYLASGFDADEIGESKGIVLGYVGKKPPFETPEKPKVKPVTKKSDDEDR